MAVLRKEIPLWDKWNASLLRNKKEDIGEREFGRGWRQQAITDDEVLFKEESIKNCLSPKDRLFFPQYDNREDVCPKSYKIYMGIDLAIAQVAKKGDYFVICTIAVDQRTYNRRLVGLYRNRGLSFNEQIQKVALWADFFNPEIVLVENNAYQEAFVQELKRKTPLPVKSFTTTALKKMDIENGLPRLSVEIENKKWIIPYGDARTKEHVTPLIEELKTYPLGRNDDCLMGFWFARNAAVDFNFRIKHRIRILN